MDIQKGKTFTDAAPGNTVTAADLHNLVDNATILPAFVGEKPAATPDPADCLLIYQASTAQFRKVTAAQLLALVPPPPDAPGFPVFVGPAQPARGCPAAMTSSGSRPARTTARVW